MTLQKTVALVHTEAIAQAIAVLEEEPMTDQAESNLAELTVDLLAAFVSNNSIGAKDLPDLIASTHAALAALESKPASELKRRLSPSRSGRRPSLFASRSPNVIISSR